MKTNKVFPVAFSLLLLSLFVLDSCKRSCTKNSCINGSCVEGVCECEAGYFGENCDSTECDLTCVNGNCQGFYCQCDYGYTGNNCDIISNSYFLGMYNVAEACSDSSMNNYLVELQPSPADPTEFYLIGMHQFADTLDCKIQHPYNGNFSIPVQAFPTGNFSGNGVRANNGTITIAFQYEAGPAVIYCTSTLMPQ